MRRAAASAVFVFSGAALHRRNTLEERRRINVDVQTGKVTTPHVSSPRFGHWAATTTSWLRVVGPPAVALADVEPVEVSVSSAEDFPLTEVESVPVVADHALEIVVIPAPGSAEYERMQEDLPALERVPESEVEQTLEDEESGTQPESEAEPESVPEPEPEAEPESVPEPEPEAQPEEPEPAPVQDPEPVDEDDGESDESPEPEPFEILLQSLNGRPERDFEMVLDNDGIGAEPERSFPAYQSVTDVRLWVRDYYDHVDADLALEALEALVREGMFSPGATDGGLSVGFVDRGDSVVFFFGVLLSLLQRHEDVVADWLPRLSRAFSLGIGAGVSEAEVFASGEANVLATALWGSSSPSGHKFLGELLSKAEQQGELGTVSRLKQIMALPNLDVQVAEEVTFLNARVKIPALRGKYSVFGRDDTLDILANLAKDFHAETLAQDGDEYSFMVGKEARQTLIEMALEDDKVLSFCENKARASRGRMHDVMSSLTAYVRQLRADPGPLAAVQE
jgi:hypothetical protein